MAQAAPGTTALMLIVSAILLSAPTGRASPTSGTLPSGPPIPFSTLAQGTASEVHGPVRMVIHDVEGWGRLWSQLLGPGHRPPAVDFGRDMVIALSSGPTSEPATLTITRITRAPGKLVVWYTVAHPRPLPEGGNARSTAPYHVVRLARSPLPVDFVFLKTPPIMRSPSAPARGAKDVSARWDHRPYSCLEA